MMTNGIRNKCHYLLLVLVLLLSSLFLWVGLPPLVHIFSLTELINISFFDCSYFSLPKWFSGDLEIQIGSFQPHWMVLCKSSGCSAGTYPASLAALGDSRATTEDGSWTTPYQGLN